MERWASSAMFSDRELGAQAASAEFHSSVIVALHPPSLPVLNCPFLIFSASSIPEIVTAALSNRLNPQHRPDSLLHSPMVLLHQIVQVLAGSNLDATRKFAVFLHLSRSEEHTSELQS